MVDPGANLEPLTLLDGPLHRLGCWLNLVRGTTNTVGMGRFFSLALVGAPARLRVAIPLFFIAESELAPRFSAFVRYLARSAVVPRQAVPSLQAMTARTMRW